MGLSPARSRAGAVYSTRVRAVRLPGPAAEGPRRGYTGPLRPRSPGRRTVTPMGGPVGLQQRASQPCAVLAALSSSLAFVAARGVIGERAEEHTSELQSRENV